MYRTAARKAKARRRPLRHSCEQIGMRRAEAHVEAAGTAPASAPVGLGGDRAQAIATLSLDASATADSDAAVALPVST